MPEVPPLTSTESYGFTPLQPTSPGADSAASSALASAGSQVSAASDDLNYRLTQHFNAVQQQQKRSQQMVDASSIESQGATDLAAMRLTSLKDPDYANAGQNFLTQAQGYKQQTLGGIQDPQVKAYVSQALDKHIAANGIAVMSDALKNGNAAQSASILGANDQDVTTAAAAPNDAALKATIDGINARAQGGVQAQLYTPLQARTMTSAAVRQIITLRSLTDPAGAQGVMQQYGGLLTSGDQLAAAEHLQPRVQKMQGDALGGAAFGAATGGAAPGDLTGVVHQLESGGSMAPGQTGDGGMAHGPMQVHGPALADVNAKLGTSYTQQQLEADPVLGRNVGATYLGMQVAKYGRPDYALGAYNQGPGAMDAAIASGKGVAGLPGGGPQYVARGMAMLGPAGASQASTDTPGQAPGLYPDDEKAMDVIGKIDDPVVQQRAVAAYQRQKHQFLAGQSQQLAAMNDRLTNVSAGLQAGLDVDVPAESDIRQLYPPAKANEIMGKLGDMQQFGLIRQSVDLASPTDITAMRQQLADGTGLLPRMLALKSGAGMAGTAPTEAADGTVNADGLARKLKQQAMFESVVQKRNADLMADPATFAASRDPALQPFAAAIQANPKDPTANQNFATALLASQDRMGVPASQQRILTNGQVQSEVDQLHSVDPSKGSMTMALDGMAKQFGSTWPQAFGELVRVGKLDPAYQVLGSMTDPSQAGARQDLQRVLQLSAQKGGLSQLQADAPPDAVKSIKGGLDDTIAPFRTAYSDNPGGVSLIANVRSSIEHMATLYAMQGASASDALSRAYQGVVSNRWDTSDTMIAPKGTMADVQRSTAGVQQGLTAADLAPIADTTTGLRTPDEQRAMALQQAQRGQWRPNEDASGLVLTRSTRTGQVLPVLRTDGSHVEVKFGGLPTPAAPSYDPGQLTPMPLQ